MKRFSALLMTFLVLIAVAGCGKSSLPQSSPTASPTVSLPTPGPRQNPCGDGVCGPAEKANPNLCPADCAAANASPTQTAISVAAPTPIQSIDALPKELTFIPDPGIRISIASQPAPVVGADGAIYIFYNKLGVLPNDPSSNAVARSEDGLTFTKVGLDPNRVSAVNPFAVQLADGRWRLYDVDEDVGVMTSRSSTDGIHFAQDEGVRYKFPSEHLPIGVRDFYANPSGEIIFLYIGARETPDGHIRRAVSTDGGNTFTFHSDNVLGDWGKPIFERNVDPKFVVLPDGGSARLFTMVQGNAAIPGQQACCPIYSFTTVDGYTFTQDPGTRLQASDFTEFTVWSLNDPWAIVLPDGRCRLYVAALVEDGSSSKPFWAILSATNP